MWACAGAPSSAEERFLISRMVRGEAGVSPGNEQPDSRKEAINTKPSLAVRQRRRSFRLPILHREPPLFCRRKRTGGMSWRRLDCRVLILKQHASQVGRKCGSNSGRTSIHGWRSEE